MERCSAFPFHVRESRGLIWLSVEDEPGAVFPGKVLGDESLPIGSWSLEVKGDPLLWIDHDFDYSHFPHTHVGSIFTGGRDSIPETTFTPGPGPGSEYPYRTGTIAIRGALKSSFILAVGQAGGFWNYLKRAAGGSAYGEIIIEVGRVNPVCQRFVISYVSRFGKWTADFTSFVNPVSPGAMVYHQLVAVHPSRSWPWTPLAHWALRREATRHIFDEDGPFVLSADTSDLGKMRLAPSDRLLERAREALVDYARRKGALYPASSLIHRLAREAPRPAPFRAVRNGEPRTSLLT